MTAYTFLQVYIYVAVSTFLTLFSDTTSRGCQWESGPDFLHSFPHMPDTAGSPVGHVPNNTAFEWGGVQRAEAGCNRFDSTVDMWCRYSSSTPAAARVSRSSLDIFVSVLYVLGYFIFFFVLSCSFLTAPPPPPDFLQTVHQGAGWRKSAETPETLDAQASVMHHAQYQKRNVSIFQTLPPRR